MRKTRVLVVDDEPDVRMLMSTALEDSGFDVVIAKDVPTAKKLLLSEIPDIVITDLMMPEESGFSLISYLRENPATKNTPIIVTSVMESENEVMQQGAEAFLPKPFSADEPVDLVSQLAHKEDIPHMMERALEYIRARNYKQAEGVLQEILQSGEQGTYPAYAAFYLGEITRIMGNKDEAENFYKLAVQHGPDFWRAYNELGNLAQARNDLHRAIAYWKRSLGINTDQQSLKELVERLQKEVVSSE
jgi:twitching motility two-component system response regulator PilH